MKNKYQHILRKDRNIEQTAVLLSEKYASSSGQLAVHVTAPVLVMYVHWILTVSEQRGIQRLYFLARDGYLMYHIAQVICKYRRLNIQCSYFYCSRYVLRMAAYRFYDDSAYHRLFIHAYQLTAYNMLRRADFIESERMAVYTDIGFPPSYEQSVMGRTEFDRFCNRVRNSAVFREILTRKSEAAYPDTLAYILQEEIQKYRTIGIVDLGWTGSLQYTLRRLLDSRNIHTKLIGFYMGMLDKPPVSDQNEYITWLFNSYADVIKAWFSQNLLECLCSAPHGMTTGYQQTENGIKPIFFKNTNNPALISETQIICEEFAGLCDVTYQPTYQKLALHLLKSLMFSPTADEIQTLSAYCFCDDVGEQYHSSIVQSADARQFRKQLMFHKLFNRESADGFYWYYGSVRASRLRFKPVYKYGYFLTRYILSRLKRGGVCAES